MRDSGGLRRRGVIFNCAFKEGQDSAKQRRAGQDLPGRGLRRSGARRPHGVPHVGTWNSSGARVLNRPPGRGAVGRLPQVDFLPGGRKGTERRAQNPSASPATRARYSEPWVTTGSKVRVWPACLDSVSLAGNNSRSVFYGQPEEPPLCVPQGRALPWDQASFSLSLRPICPLCGVRGWS